MNGVTVDIDLSFFVGRRLELVSFGEHQLQLHFDDHVSLVIESVYRIAVDGRLMTYDDLRAGAVQVVALISIPVTAASRLDEKSIRIEFGAGRALEAVDDSFLHESFQIWNGVVVAVV